MGAIPLLVIAIVSAGSLAADPSATVVYPRLLERRSDDGERVVRLTEDIVLNLRPSDVLADRIEYVEDSDGVLEDMDTKPYKRDLYEDPTQGSSVIMRTTEDGVILEGVLRNKYFIRPTRAAERLDDGQIAHRIHNMQHLTNGDDSDDDEAYGALQPAVEGRAEDEEPVPNNVTFELYVVSDTKHYKFFPKRRCLVMYLALFFNSVNYYLASMENPKVQVRIVGIRRAGPSIRKQFIAKIANTSYVDPMETMFRFSNYTKSSRLSEKADLVLLLTGYDLANVENHTVFKSYSDGKAYRNGLCTDYCSAIVEDRPAGFYQGARTAAHEIGHLLGSSHDKNDAGCSSKLGFLMSYQKGTDNYYRFSNCSKESIRTLIKQRGKSCWESKGRVTMGTNYTYFPGANLTMEKLCKRMFPDQNVTVYTDSKGLGRPCRFACCRPVDPRKPNLTCRPFDSLDGMPCENGKVCMGGICVDRSQRR